MLLHGQGNALANFIIAETSNTQTRLFRPIIIAALICFGALLESSARQVITTEPYSQVSKVGDTAKPIGIPVEWRWADTIPQEGGSKLFSTRQVCKGTRLHYLIGLTENHMEAQVGPGSEYFSIPTKKKKKTQLLKITGNVLYDVNYRSRIDTPYAENNVYQHTLQTRIDAIYKDRYPLRIYVTTRFSNSDLFRKYTDLNLQFNQADFKRMIKARAVGAIEQYAASKSSLLDSLLRIIEKTKSAIAALQPAVKRPDLGQKIVEERERALFSHNSEKRESSIRFDTDSPAFVRRAIRKRHFEIPDNTPEFLRTEESVMTLKANPASGTLQNQGSSTEARKMELDSLLKKLAHAESLYRSLKSVQQFEVGDLKRQIEGATDIHSLVNKLRGAGISDTILPKGYKTLFAVQSFSIGRSTADYSELSARNISITGVQLEYNPRYYYAIAAGKVDYRFRDYIVTKQSRSNQFLALARIGKGTRKGNHLFFTYYTGKRQFYNGVISTQPGNTIPEYKLAGITIEALYHINRNISVIGEIAKSTVPYYSRDSLVKTKWMNAITNFNERSNEAYSIKLLSYFPKTLTRFSGNIRYTGANFQSFSTFTTGAAQLRWTARLEQPLLKKRLTLLSSVQQNDYYNPLVTASYKTSALLASFQANLRMKKWPILSVGYYPSYQLTKTGADSYTESRYYTLSASAGYFYAVQTAQLSSYIVYSRFYNTASDSGFVYYNSRNILFNQNLIWRNITTAINLSVSLNTEYTIYTTESTGQFNINKLISAGAGIKLIKHSLQPNVCWGYNGSVILKIPKFGELQLMMDKGFIPGLNRTLIENKMGRLTYYKTF